VTVCVNSDEDARRADGLKQQAMSSSDSATTEQFESTGLFHWCSNRPFDSAVLVSRHTLRCRRAETIFQQGGGSRSKIKFCRV